MMLFPQHPMGSAVRICATKACIRGGRGERKGTTTLSRGSRHDSGEMEFGQFRFEFWIWSLS
ncbi:hypothetical protein Pyn_19917 [Prunus yedoensis var. nudiflora]|uniref:Uncharacterized protein n=1 Tax=Prunus yedoensis var. nudiflora TaxID=2094558 RepID=A0A314Z4J5_PRUYE|nr:hypothetical protein Pyn_19917 [Prunus yedoensis var. nudiflora]